MRKAPASLRPKARGKSLRTTPGTNESPAAARAARRGADLKSCGAVAAMIVAVIAVYVPVPAAPGDNTLWGADFFELHFNRIRFAQAALFGPQPHLPAWYPRELLGTPFWSNIQSFPFLPTRLILLGLDPLNVYAIAVILGASLAALFTFLYARRIGLSRIAAAAAGWTFACAGFYASRVMAGHLPLLEVYGALPLLLWLIERYRAAPSDLGRSLSLAVLGVACACLALAGHPQIPLYAGGAALIYLLVRLPWGAAVRAAGVMAAGGLCAGFVLWPMWLLIGRSTRVLALDPPSNDIAFPYRRLIALVLPWAQGWPAAVTRSPRVPLAFADPAYFWETVNYIGLLPLAAAAFLLVRAVVARKRPPAPMTFLALLAIGGLLMSFPAARAPFAHLPGTFLRSPARLLYFAEFALAIGFGAATDQLLDWATPVRQLWAAPRWIVLALAIALTVHAIDLGSHDRHFIRMVAYNGTLAEGDVNFAKAIGTGRVAIDVGLMTPLNRQIDDIGYFDSIALAKPYRAILDMAGLPPRLNTQYLDGSELNLRALSTCGVKAVVTNKYGSRGRPIPIRNAGPRVQFFPLDAVQFSDLPQTHQNLRDPRVDLQRTLMLPPEARAAGDGEPPPIRPSHASPAIQYARDDRGQITTTVNADQPGYVLWLDTWDPGWHATLDGAPAPVQIADDVFRAVRVPPGIHTIRLDFSTPGAVTGMLISVIGILLLATLSFGPVFLSQRDRASDPETPSSR
ncbi:MAG TPA: YfhO family protein [Tepidisphaeraceae bacterium]|jgi:hypothetical protein